MSALLLTGAEAPQRYHVKQMRLWQRLVREGRVDWRKTYHARIEHDDWCVIFQGQPRCTCDPDLSFIPHRIAKLSTSVLVDSTEMGYCFR